LGKDQPGGTKHSNPGAIENHAPGLSQWLEPDYLIGFNSLQSMTIEDALIDIDGEVESVWGYKDGVWKTYNPKNPGFSDLEEMEPGMGYWVKITGE